MDCYVLKNLSDLKIPENITQEFTSKYLKINNIHLYGFFLDQLFVIRFIAAYKVRLRCLVNVRTRHHGVLSKLLTLPNIMLQLGTYSCILYNNLYSSILFYYLYNSYNTYT